MGYLCPKVHLNISVQAADFIRKERENQEEGVEKVSICRPAQPIPISILKLVK